MRNPSIDLENNPTPATRIDHVMAAIHARIQSHSLLPGDRLPSIRAGARQFGVSNSTMVEAYDRLVADGSIQARRGSGFFVANGTSPLSLAQLGPKLDREIDPFWVTRQSLESPAGMLKPGCGWLPADWMPEDAIRRALRHVSRGSDALLADYGTPLGLAPLRQLLSRRAARHGIHADPDHILLTDSGTQAIDLLCRLFLRPGDTVLVDDPCYFNFHALLRAHQANVIAVNFDQDGPDPHEFSRLASTHNPRLYITNSGLHNPTGAALSPLRAHHILKIIEQHDMIVIEDDIFADFEITPAPRLAAMGGLERVVHIGSFSKTLSASMRCGYIAARPDWIDGLVNLRIATGFASANLAAEIIHTVLKDGSYRRHLDGLHARLAKARASTETRLRDLGIHPAIRPMGGIFLWCRLPDGIDGAALARHALGDGVVLAPGNVFSLSQNAAQMMRFNVAQCQDDRIYRVLARAIAALS